MVGNMWRTYIMVVNDQLLRILTDMILSILDITRTRFELLYPAKQLCQKENYHTCSKSKIIDFVIFPGNLIRRVKYPMHSL